jgi:zinc transporter ZupT
MGATPWPALVATIAAVVATAAGGLLAFRFRTRLPRLAAFGAGALIAAALLDLLPEALELGGMEPGSLFLGAAAGFFSLYVLEKLALFHAHDEPHASAAHRRVGVLGAAGVSLQSLIDGMALGASFAADAATGGVVTLAVMLHKLTDGTSTVGLILASGNPATEARKWLALASVAPLVGLGLSMVVDLPAAALAFLLAFFAGTFLYLGASHLLPEAHDAEPGASVALATLGGFGVVLVVGQLLGGH